MIADQDKGGDVHGEDFVSESASEDFYAVDHRAEKAAGTPLGDYISSIKHKLIKVAVSKLF